MCVAASRRGGGLRWSHQVAVDDDVGLNDAFAGEDDVFGPEDGGAAGDLVARFLRVGSVRLGSWVEMGALGCGREGDGGHARSRCTLRERRVWAACLGIR